MFIFYSVSYSSSLALKNSGDRNQISIYTIISGEGQIDVDGRHFVVLNDNSTIIFVNLYDTELV